jgi:hydroxymethylbilane synthase
MSARSLEKIILGSRGSELARAQTDLVTQALLAAWPELEIETKVISTRGDRTVAEPVDLRAGRKGLFTGEIERALAAGEIDAAVHSAKDLPSEMTEGLEIGAVLARAAFEDVLIGKTADVSKPVIATGSVRRRHQLQWKKPGVQVVDLRGNVPTRLRKFVESDWQAIVLARAGLERLGYDLTERGFDLDGISLRAEMLPSDDFLPPGGQGVIAIQVRSDDARVKAIVQSINDSNTLSCLEAEREFLRLLQGDCGSPVGVLAKIAGATMNVRAQIFEPPRIEPRTARVEGPASAPKKLARDLWEAING